MQNKIRERFDHLYQSLRASDADILREQGFPKEEQYSLTDQIRRSSRSVCSNLREAWAKRRYKAHFVSKLTDADGENAEIQTWLDFGCDCGYISKADHAQFIERSHEIGAMLGRIINDPSSFILR